MEAEQHRGGQRGDALDNTVVEVGVGGSINDEVAMIDIIDVNGRVHVLQQVLEDHGVWGLG